MADLTRQDIARLEAKVDLLTAMMRTVLASLVEEDMDPPDLTLEGTPAGGAREPGQSLG